jgi:hypothetical protein
MMGIGGWGCSAADGSALWASGQAIWTELRPTDRRQGSRVERTGMVVRGW